jgi:hypothetical protein
MLVVVLTAIIILPVAATSSWAHGKRPDNWETATIAVGAAVLVNALANPGYFGPPYASYGPIVVYVNQPNPRRRGHWKRHDRHQHKPWKRHRGRGSRHW